MLGPVGQLCVCLSFGVVIFLLAIRQLLAGLCEVLDALVVLGARIQQLCVRVGKRRGGGADAGVELGGVGIQRGALLCERLLLCGKLCRGGIELCFCGGERRA